VARLRSLRSSLERIAVAAFALGALWLLWCASTERPIDVGPAARTRYGVLGWRSAEWHSPQRGVARAWPWASEGLAEIKPWRTVATTALTLLVLGYMGLVAHRLERNRRPRGICVHCGHRVREGFERTAFCPECGRLPNARPSALMPF
jgi:hypothetical protein